MSLSSFQLRRSVWAVHIFLFTFYRCCAVFCVCQDTILFARLSLYCRRSALLFLHRRIRTEWDGVDVIVVATRFNRNHSPSSYGLLHAPTLDVFELMCLAMTTRSRLHSFYWNEQHVTSSVSDKRNMWRKSTWNDWNYHKRHDGAALRITNHTTTTTTKTKSWRIYSFILLDVPVRVQLWALSPLH